MSKDDNCLCPGCPGILLPVGQQRMVERSDGHQTILEMAVLIRQCALCQCIYNRKLLRVAPGRPHRRWR